MTHEQLNTWMLEHLAPLGFRDELGHPLHLSNNVRDALRSALQAEYERGKREEREALSESIAFYLECVANSPLGNAETERVLRFEAEKIRKGPR